jgi:glycerol uptake facilitator-like aquaporin
LFRKTTAEFLGTALLVVAVVGSGEMATNLSRDRGVQLLINSISTVLALGVLISILTPVSGAHFNPLVTLVELFFRRISAINAGIYLAMQLLGGFVGAMYANLMFKNPAIFQSHQDRSGVNLLLGEVIASAGLVLIILILLAQRRANLVQILVPLWIGSAYFATSSTSFANPAVTFARGWSDTFAGIDLKSIPAFVVAQLLGTGIGIALSLILIENPPHLKGK